jgi:formylglycine-generating enzyme required for sulfatase activity
MMGRSNDGSDAYARGEDDERPEHEVTVSAFYLDKYEVTVGRFRAFVESGTWVPADGAGAHPLIQGTGWQSVWDDELPAALTGTGSWNDVLACTSEVTWTADGSADETLPIVCVNWYEAMAFCVWDGGRLPTEAEWEYAAAGGNENRLYPWGSTAPAGDCVLANWRSCAINGVRSVGLSPAGAGRWGHSDLAGNVFERTFDWYESNWYLQAGASTQNACNVADATTRTMRGGSFANNADGLRAAARDSGYAPWYRGNYLGLRCARSAA